MIDIGANLTHRSFEDDLDDVLARARSAGVGDIIVTGTSVAESRAAVRLAATDAGLWSTGGVHPHDAKSVSAGWIDDIAALAGEPNVVAIGETGLDFNRNYSPPATQREVFAAQIELAGRLDMPLFVHDRDSGGETARLLAESRAKPDRVVIHCFTGSAEDLDTWLDAGYYIGITGWICDPRRGDELRTLAPRIPGDKLLVETDAPYLMPRTMREKPRSRRNEPAFLVEVVDALAGLRGATAAEVAETTADNARRAFRLPGQARNRALRHTSADTMDDATG